MLSLRFRQFAHRFEFRRCLNPLRSINPRISNSMEEAIRSLLPSILQQCDLDMTSERIIRAQLEEQLGPIAQNEHKTLIKNMIEAYLTEMASEDPESKPLAATKRKAEKQPSMQPLKRLNALSEEFILDLSKDKKLTVKTFKGKVQVDLREFYEDKETHELKPSPKGIALTFEQWLLLKPKLQMLSTALEQRQEEGAIVQLSSDRQAYVTEFKGKFSVHVREMYMKDGQMLPGKKGVVLDNRCIELILEFADQITSEAQQRGATSSNVQAASSHDLSVAPPAPSAAVSGLMKENINAGAPVKSADPSTSFIDLGGNRRASISEFKGKTYVSLREFYLKDSQMLPGKKGIMLTPSEFRLIAQNAAAISDAFSSGNLAFKLDLNSKRIVSISSFKGKNCVDIREFYEAGGVLKPGIKGLSLGHEMWQKFREGFHQLEADMA